MRNHIVAGWVLAVIATAAPASLSGQAAMTLPEPLCFRGRPLPHCKSFVLFELDPNWSLFSLHKRKVAAPDGFLAVDIGAMKNRPDSTAIGGSLQLGAVGGDQSRLALELRRRWWLSSNTAGDLGIGPLELNDGESLRPFAGRASYGVTSHVGLVFGDLFAFTATLDAAVVGGRRRITPSIGGRLGSHAAVGMLALFALLVAGYNDPS